MAFRGARPKTAPAPFDFDDFKKAASQESITTAIPHGRKKTYTNTLDNLEEAIIKKDFLCFKDNVSTFESLIDNCRNVKWNTIKTKFEQMKYNVIYARNKFADPFKYIQIQDSSSASSALEFEKSYRGQLAITRQNVTSLKTHAKDMETKLKKMEDKASYWKDQAIKEENEKKDYMTRLSKIASAKLANDNPNIADLSDPNRQTKLAEEYSQLYDNEWTNAFDDVERKTDLNPIDYLRDILTAVYEKCAEIRKLQIKEIEISILQPVKLLPTYSKELKNTKPQTSTGTHPEDVVLGENHRKAISEVVRQTYTDVQRNLNKYFSSSYVEWFKTQHLKEYTAKCIELCWLMNIHSPPVCLGPIVQKGAKFDTNIYRVYTARGKQVEFVVWPAILLHENGPLLGKGVAQGMK